MLAVIFELEPQAGKVQEYLDEAEARCPLLDEIDGFISIERFESLTHPGRMLSLSYWRDEEAIRQWRVLEAHRAAQQRGRISIFANYQLRVAEVRRDYGMLSREEAPADSVEKHG